MELCNDHGVYGLRCLANNKIYVGSSARSMRSRKSQHFCALRNGTHYAKAMQSDFLTYGESSFEFFVIEISDAADCVESEQRAIDEYNAADPACGYNNTPIAGCGARKGAGRKPGPNGRKTKKNIALTPDVWAFLASAGQTAGESIETSTRGCAAFKAWLKTKGEQ